MALTPEDVRNKQFATVRFKEGYDLDEVDKFLDDVEAEITRLTAENDELRQRAEAAEAAPKATTAPPTPPPAPPAAAVVPPNEAAVAMLVLAQKTADEHVANAKAEADRLLVQARTQAEAAMGEREAQRTALEKRIDELRAFEREYRSKLRSYIEGQLQELDTRTGDAAPVKAFASSTPAPVRPAAPPTPPAPAFGGGATTTRPVPPPVPPAPNPPFGGTIPTAPPREG